MEESKLSDSEDEDLDNLMTDQSKAEKHKELFDVQPYQSISCLFNFNPLEILPRSYYVAKKIWKNEESAYSKLRDMQTRNMIIFC